MSEVRRFSVLYGSSPAHLLLGLATLVVSAWAVVQAFGQGPPLSLTKWFVGSILAHDLVLLPLYSMMLIGLLRVAGGRGTRERSSPSRRRLLVVNHLRVPAALSLLMLLVFFPFILGLAGGYQGVSGLSTDPFLPRWLLLSAGLFLLSGLILVMRLVRGGASTARGSSGSAAEGGGAPPAV